MFRPRHDRAIAYVRRLHVQYDGGFGYMSGHGSTVTRASTGIVALEDLRRTSHEGNSGRRENDSVATSDQGSALLTTASIIAQ